MTGEILPGMLVQPDSAPLPVQRREAIADFVGAGYVALEVEAPPDNVITPGATETTGDNSIKTDIKPFLGTGALYEKTVEPEPGADTGATQTIASTLKPKPESNSTVSTKWEVIRRAQQGDKDAFAELYENNFSTVFRYISFRVGSRQLAEDLASDTFTRALNKIDSFTWQGRDIGAWLVTIARNLVVDHYKSGFYRLEVTTGDVLDADRPSIDRRDDPAQAAIDHITNLDLLGAVTQLNPEQQRCITLRFLEGLTVTETARAMGKNEGAIKALQYRAIRSLHRLLPEGFIPW